jgi:hypothetical protein
MMTSKRIKIGRRDTYVPPFVNERFGKTPYWACTFAALLNGVNVGFLGIQPANPTEIRALAKASGDADRRGGSQSHHMVRAMRVRYGKRMHLEALPPRRAQERLASGWALVAGLTYGELPKKFRRHSPRFKKGHRVTLVGWNAQRRETFILDPMAEDGADYEGEPIPWSAFEAAWWSGEQLWFAEGMFRKPPVVHLVDRVPEGRWRIPAGSRLIARSGSNARVIMRKVVLAEAKSGHFDALVTIGRQPDGPFAGQYMRVSSGGLNGMYIPVATKDIEIRP